MNKPQKFELWKVGDFDDYELETSPKAVIESLVDCLITYCPEHMHGRHKNEYIRAAWDCLHSLEVNHG